jgi:hypothetical protein
VATVAAVAAVIFYRHAFELVSMHRESGLTARLVPFTVNVLKFLGSPLSVELQCHFHRLDSDERAVSEQRHAARDLGHRDPWRWPR